MSIHTQRSDILKGTSTPTGRTPDFVGQFFINEATTPATVYIATAINPSTGWQSLANGGHTHETPSIVGLDSKIQDYIQQNGIQAALTTLLGSSNVWEGAFNNFLGDLKVGGSDVLTKSSSIQDLGDVSFTDSPLTETGLVLGWDGSKWSAVKLTGTGVTKSNLITDIYNSPKLDTLNSTSTNATFAKVGDYFTVTFNAAGANHYFQMGSNKTTTGITDLGLAPGDTITFGADFENTKNVNFQFEFYRSGTWQVVAKTVTPQNFGTRQVLTTTIPMDATGLRIRIISITAATAGDIVKFRHPRLLKGSEDMPFYNFDAYLNKNLDIANNLTTAATDKALSAAQGMALKNYIDNNFAPKDHEHAFPSHTHDNYFDKTVMEVLSNGIEFQNVSRPFFMTASTGETLSLNLSEEQLDGSMRHSLEVDGVAGEQMNLYVGGAAEASGDTLTLNFDTLHLPSGRIVTDGNNGRILFPPIKIEQEDTQYVSNSSIREYGLHLNNNAMIGIGQLVFSHAARTKADGLLFPRSSAGNTQPSEIGQYNYMYILDDALVTDAAFTSKKNYIELNGRRIFFSATEPGREARPGDILIKI